MKRVKGEHKIYALICPITGTIKYIGKTVFELLFRLDGHFRDKDPGHKGNWIKSLKAKGLVPEIP